VFSVGNNAIMMVMMFTLAYFLLMLIISAFNLSNPFGPKTTDGADELTE